jgi:hypothetical protein
MTTDVLESTLEDLEWTLVETSNIRCQFLLRYPCKGTPCLDLAIARVRAWCTCGFKGIFWVCDKHLRWLREGKIGCSKCSDVGNNITWELI